MKKHLKFFFVGYVIFLFAGMISCEGDDDCPQLPNPLYKTADIQIEVFKFKEDIDSRTLTQVLGDSLRFDAVALQLNSEFESVNSEQASNTNFSMSFIENAYACSPLIPYTDDQLLDIEIFADTDFDTNLPFGSNLKEVFDVVFFETFGEINSERIDLQEFLNTERSSPIRMTLVLKKAPKTDQPISFTVNVVLKGSVLGTVVLNTIPVKIY